MKIGIIVAMDKEFAQLKTLLTESQVERKNHKDFVIGKIGNNEVVMQQCGIGYDMFYADLTYDIGLANICHDSFDKSRNGALQLNFGVNF